MILFSLIYETQATFPPGFIWGASTAAYQVEGAYRDEGRTLSIWDIFSHTPGKVYGNQTGDITDDHYHLVDTDIALMQAMGLHYYRMSLSWNRLLPQAFKGTPVNPVAVAHYNAEIDKLLAAGIQPFVTLFHWDLPQILQEAYGGWLHEGVTEHFANYASVCFGLFGDRVKYWLTLNEPHTVAFNGYYDGSHAPGRCSNRSRCKHGHSETEPYIVAKNMLLAHGQAVRVYRDHYQPSQQGHISLALDLEWGEPFNATAPDDVAAAERYVDFWAGWFAEPIFGSGNWPASMISHVGGNRLPLITPTEQALIRGSADFFAMNHYTASYCAAPAAGWTAPAGYLADQQVVLSVERNGQLIGAPAASSWLYVVPYGIRKGLNWIRDHYGQKLPIIITENGVDVPGENEMSLQQALNDTFRIAYYQSYLTQVALAINEDHVNVVGYFAWSLLDNFEWADGFSKRFGLHYVDYQTLKRYPKQSASFYHQIIQSNSIPN